MASLIPGYEYDIFISYRQKDNKHDGWVTEFVDNLKGELESTFKEDVSVYFDTNPHDGLLETHDVKASLKEKLKCLVFIPIISRTYCDPKSFAWEHEFKAFIEQASNDKNGLKIRLPGGNIANRVLPVLIHDLDLEDKKLVESELGGFIRGIEFIYNEPGVNRPLRANEDNPDNNLNKTFYRNQINKGANAVKEIIMGLKNTDITVKELPGSEIKNGPPFKKASKRNTIAGALVFIAIVVAGYFILPKLFNPVEQNEKSIAVLPFKLFSDEPDKQYLADGMMDAITLHLSKIKDLRVMSRTSVEQYRETTKTTHAIGQELGVEYLLEGSFQKYGNDAKLIVQLIRTKEESHAWANEYNCKWSDVFSLQSEVAQKIAIELDAAISPEEKDYIEKKPTANLAAYDAYLKGQFFYEKDDGKEKAIPWFKEAIMLDSSFALPWTYLSMLVDSPTICLNRSMNGKQLAERALELDPNSGIALVNMAEILDHEFDLQGAEEKIKSALKIDPNNPYILRNAGRFYTITGKADESISFCKLSLRNDPNNSKALEYLAKAYFYSDRYNEAWSTLNKYYELEFKGLPDLYYKLLLARGNLDKVFEVPQNGQEGNFHNIALAAAYFKLNDKKKAEELCADLNNNLIPAYWIALIYAYGDEPEKVYEWLEKSYDKKETQLIYLEVEPAFKKFKNGPKIKELLQKMKFSVL
jgi:TolB-like protein